MRQTLLLCVLLLTQGCAAFDAPKFTPTQYNTDLHIKVQFTEDFSVLEKKFNFESLAGMTEYIDFKGTCILYIPSLEEVMDGYTMCIAGHEFFHCILGSFHEEDDGATCKEQT